MKKIIRFKNNTVLLLITAIVVLCIGFIVVGCGKGPQLKTDDPNKGQYALDFSGCPGGLGQCTVSFSNAGGVSKSIGATPFTMEAWIKPKSDSEQGIILMRGASKKGAVLSVETGTANSVLPRFTIKRVQSDGTTSATYAVDGTLIAINSVWTHIAGVLTNKDHSSASGHPTCAGAGVDGDATDDPWHLDFYQNGTIVNCKVTHDGVSTSDDTLPANAYAHEPEGTAAVMDFNGVVDELRLWNTDRTITDCMNSELGLSGICSRISDNLVLYSRFNSGVGHFTNDWSGIFGAGANEYENTNDLGNFHEWSTGWTTDTPTLNTAD